MKIYKTQEEVEDDIKNGVLALAIDDDVTFECDISIDADINARDINGLNIIALNIIARDIDALDIIARDIDALDIYALDIDAKNISYYAFCLAYGSIKCESIKGRRKPHHKPICLDGKLKITKTV